ncbi:hypothetical protein ATCC90586_002826 [Pythium insidiosum]|nr:hypothetical protein ATCC90586_002826 [Pythium insidiosum]
MGARQAVTSLTALLDRHADVFRIWLGRDPPVDMPPMVIRLKLPQCEASMVLAAGDCDEARIGNYRMTVDVRSPNTCVEPVAWSMPILEVALDRIPVAADSQEVYSILTEDRVIAPTRARMGGSNSDAADYLLQRPEGFLFFMDHRNLKYIFDPHQVRSSVQKYTADKLHRRSLVLMAYKYELHDISGDDNVWADLLSRWGSAYKAVTAIKPVPMPLLPQLDDKFQ